MSRTQHNVSVTGIRLHCACAGSGPVVVLLHGFPETHRSWELQIEHLAAQGYRVVAPDLRGYGESDRPEHGYDLDTLSEDVAGLIVALGAPARAVIGHDWGAVITWHLGARHPKLLERAVVLDCPPERVLSTALRQNLGQIRRGWYIFFFQLPALPERWLCDTGGSNLARLFRDEPGRDRRPREVAAADVAALASARGLAGPLAYYRTALRRAPRSLVWRSSSLVVRVPVTLVWGERDSCVGVELVDGCRKFAPRLAVEIVPGAGHFVHQERPEDVNRILVDALGRAAL